MVTGQPNSILVNLQNQEIIKSQQTRRNIQDVTKHVDEAYLMLVLI